MIGAGTQAEQNRAHRNDLDWLKTKGRDFRVDGQRYVSEYLNPWNGWAIRKHFGTGLNDGSWCVFNAEGVIVDKAHSLTFAKGVAALRMAESGAGN